MPVPSTGQIKISNIKTARNEDGTSGGGSNNYAALRNGAIFSRFDSAYLQGATQLSQINRFTQWRNYPLASLLLIGGSFTKIATTPIAQSLTRLNTNGTLDSTYNNIGGFNNEVKCVKIQSDGKLLVGGRFTSYKGTNYNKIIRLNTDGTIDNTFNVGTGFFSNNDHVVNDIQILSTGKIIVGGNFYGYGGIDEYNTNLAPCIVRLNSDGSYDSTFSMGNGFDGEVKQLAIQSDGKILVCGRFYSYNGTTSPRIARLNTNGTYDSTFNVGSGFDYDTYSIKIQSDGKIIAGGWYSSYNGTSSNFIARLNTNGTYDSTFNVGTGFNYYILNTHIQSDGKILACGYFSEYNGNTSYYIARLNTNGTYDSTFNVGTGFDNFIGYINTQSDGKILVGGQFSSYNGTTSPFIARLNTNGTYDSTFNVGNGFDSEVLCITIQSNGLILMGGSYFTMYNPVLSSNIAKIDVSSLTVNPSFTVGTGFDGEVSQLIIQSDNKILCRGSFYYYNGNASYFIARLNTNGTYDSTFNVGTGFNGYLSKMLYQSDGKILVCGGFYSYKGTTSPRIARLNTNGTYDSTFNVGYGFNGGIDNMIMQSDGKVIVWGYFSSYNGTTSPRIARLNTNGTYDSTFNVGSGFDYQPINIVIQSDGKLLCFGDFNSYNGTSVNYFVRLNTNGTIDTTFNSGGTGFNYVPSELKYQSNGKMILVGSFTEYNGNSCVGIARLNTNGTYDSTFNVGTGLGSSMGSGQADNLLIQPDDKIIIFGYFTSYNGTTSPYIARLNSNGTYDSTFNVGTGFDSYMGSNTYLQSDGKIIFNGYFGLYNGNGTGNIAADTIRINSNGSFDGTFLKFNGTIRTIIEA